MNSITNFVNKNKVMITLLICFAVVLGYWILKYRNIERLQTVVQNRTMEIGSIINKYVHLKYDFNDQQFYLGLISIDECIGAKKGLAYECSYNIPILQLDRNKYSTFELVLSEGFYKLRSIVDSVIPGKPSLSQHLNFTQSSTLLCFDDGFGHTVNFHVEESREGYIFKFIKNNEAYYLTKCKAGNEVCKSNNQLYRRLCLTKNKIDAIGFDIELAIEQPPVSNVVSEDHSQESNISMLPQIASES